MERASHDVDQSSRVAHPFGPSSSLQRPSHAVTRPGWRRSVFAGLRGIADPLGRHVAGPHLRRDWAHPAHICTGTALTPATSAYGKCSSLTLWPHPSHICAGTGPTPATPAPGLGSLRHACTGTGPELHRCTVIAYIFYTYMYYSHAGLTVRRLSQPE